MNSNTSRFPALSVRRSQFSPLGSRHILSALRWAPSRPQAAVPAADSLTPATPVLRDLFWNPHLIDRLQTPLSRVRE